MNFIFWVSRLLSEEWNTVDSPSTSTGILQGFVTYPEALSFIKFGGIVHFDSESLVPYTFKDYDWISYDNAQSIALKVIF